MRPKRTRTTDPSSSICQNLLDVPLANSNRRRSAMARSVPWQRLPRLVELLPETFLVLRALLDDDVEVVLELLQVVGVVLENRTRNVTADLDRREPSLPVIE